MKSKTIRLLILILLVSASFLRLWHVDFGLPHSFYADEPEIAEPAIKYTYEAKDILQNNNYYKLIPVSFVYGTLPAYLLTAGTMIFSKTSNLLHLAFDKASLYIFMRSFTAILSLLIISSISWLFYKIYKSRWGGLMCFFLLAFNWKLIVHAHYVNQDIFLTILLSLSFLTLYLYTRKDFDHKFTLATGILFGLAVGTKITALVSLPLYLYIFYVKKDQKGLLAFLFTTIGTFMASNPFSVIFFKDFSYRIYEMMFKEGGMVFDSVDYSPFKYLSALSYISTLPILGISLYGIYRSFKNRVSVNKTFHIFLVGNILIYLVFYSLQSRRVDRWLLPIIPLVIFYAAYGFAELRKHLSQLLYVLLAALSFIYYLYFPYILLQEFRQNTPKSAAYIWAQKNIPMKQSQLPYILVYTEEGLDPMNKLSGTKVIQINVYVSEEAQYMLPENPSFYDYVIVSSRPLSNYKRPEVRKAYPVYSTAWENFEKQLHDTNNFELIEKFTLPKPNLIPLSDVYIYRNLKVIPQPLAAGRVS